MKARLQFFFAILFSFTINFTAFSSQMPKTSNQNTFDLSSDKLQQTNSQADIQSQKPELSDKQIQNFLDERGQPVFQKNEMGNDIRRDSLETDAIQEYAFTGAAAGDDYGWSVSSAGDVNADGYDDIIIGSPFNDAGGSDAGRAYIYFGGPVIDYTADVILTGTSGAERFGWSVSSTGDVNNDGYADVIIGSPYYNGDGRAYIYFGGANMNNTPDVILNGSTNFYFGWSVSSAGDVNGDGFSDVLVGVPNVSAAYLYFGGSSMDNVYDLSFNESLTALGTSVACAGDVNNDGFSDFIIGAPNFNSFTGKTYVYFGGYSVDNGADVILNGTNLSDEFGNAVSSAGDVNGDGFSDVLVGAYTNGTAAQYAGRAYIFYGGASMNNTADIIISGSKTYDFLGQSVSGAGDINGDGYDDVLIGAYQNDEGGLDAGIAYLFYGGSSMNNVPDNIFKGKNPGDQFGNSVACAGDFNNDGYSDMLIGAYTNDDAGTDAGKAYLYTNTVNSTHIAMQTFTGSFSFQNFGYSVSSAGDVNGDGFDDIIVGSYYFGNSAFIYYGGEFMDNIADVTLTGTTFFGYQVAGAGDVNNDGYDDVIVSDPDINSFTPGAAFIFYGGVNMNNIVDVTLTGEAVADRFGLSISTAGDVNNDGFDDVIVGAYYNDAGGTDAGRAYIYYGGNSMNNGADVVLTGEGPFDFFGVSVSNAGKINQDNFYDVIVGAPGNDVGGNAAGRAYIYYGGTIMNNTVDLIFTGVNAGDFFGWSLESAGDVNGDTYNDLILGAIYPGNGSGRAYIFYGGIILDNIADVTFIGENDSYEFGSTLSSLGDINKDGFSDIIIGESLNSTSNFNKGRVSIYYGGAVMNNIADRIIYGEESQDRFGYSISNAGDVDRDGINEFIVGAPGKYEGAQSVGKVYMFKPSETGTDVEDQAFVGAPNDQFGYSVSFAGDVNADGYDDIIVGSLYNDASGTDAGRAFIYFGGAISDNIPDVTLSGVATGDHFGTSVSYAGDVNADSYPDVIVGSPDNDAAGTDAGRAYIYFGGPGMNNVADVILTGSSSGDRFGFCVCRAGFVNGDAAADVIVGAPFNDAAGANSGRAYVYFGGVSMNNVADVVITGTAAGYWLGISCAYAGNVNGDFYDDVIIGAGMHDEAGFNTGEAYIYFGSPGMDNIADVILSGENANDQFGYSVSAAGNVNDDSYSDVIVGAYANDAGGIEAGRAYIYLGGASMNNTADVVMTGAAQFDFFGVSVANAYRMNSDLFEDVIVGASYNDAGGPDAGRAYVFYGGAVMDNIPDVLYTGKNAYDNFGWSVAYGGDFNIDGRTDLIIGANFNDAGGNNAGKTYIFINTNPVDQLVLTLKIILQGFFNPGPDDLNISDTMKVSLHNQNFPYNQIDITKDVINKASLNGRFFFRNAPEGTYYIRIKHRNSIETWSSSPVSFTKNTNVNYDFTAAVTKAYGSNMKQVDNSPVRYAIYSGDENQDDVIDVTDVLDIFNDSNNFLEGYVKTDVTGDYVVDVTDLLTAFNNSQNNVMVSAP